MLLEIISSELLTPFTEAILISQNPNRKSSEKRIDHFGFSLVEMALVILIVSLLLGGIVTYLNAQLTQARITSTNNKEQAIKAALISFIAKNGRLPCPAIATLAVGQPNEGVEAPTGASNTPCVGTIGSGYSANVFTILDQPYSTTFPSPSLVVSTGEVPWSSLGLTHEAALDAYADRFTYQVIWASTYPSTVQTITGMTGWITIHSSGPGVVGSPNATASPGNQTNDCRSTANMAFAYLTNWNTNSCAYAVVIVSHGADGYGAYDDNGVQIAFPAQITGSDEQENANGDYKFVIKPYSSVASNPYDDIILALAPNDLLSPLSNSGAIQNAQATVNSDFNIIKGAIIGYALQNYSPTTNNATGTNSGCTPVNPPTCNLYYIYPLMPTVVSVIPYTTPVSTFNSAPYSLNIPATVLNDPWNNPIQYSVNNATTGAPALGNPPTITSNPPTPTQDANVAFTLTSAGPDGQLGTSDDIIFNVYAGQLRQQASKY